MFINAFNENKRSVIEPELFLSKLPVGSSANKILGLLTIDLAMATRCFSPPLSWVAKCFALLDNPTCLSAS